MKKQELLFKNSKREGHTKTMNNQSDVIKNLMTCLKRNDHNEFIKQAKYILETKFAGLSYDQLLSCYNIAKKMREYLLAIKFIEKALEYNKDHFELLVKAGKCCLYLNNYAKSLYYFKEAQKIEDNCEIKYDIGVALAQLMQPEEAEKYFRDALKLNQNSDKIFASLAAVLGTNGKITEAIEMAKTALSINHKNCTAHHFMAKFGQYSSVDNIESELEKLLLDDKIKTDEKLAICFSLGQIYGDKKQFDKSFHFYKLANDKKHDDKKFNIDIVKQNATRYCNIFTKDFLESKNKLGNKSKLPIFIVGMPRSGTTLTEQILSCHSQIHGAGELSYLEHIASNIKDKNIKGNFFPTPFPECMPYMKKDEIQLLANNYLTLLTKNLGNCQKVTNKLPANFAHIGLISLLFPNAHIIHCKRHPLDVFLSIYFQHFSYVYYSSNPSLIVGYYKIYAQLMKYWHAQIPGKIFDFYYEELVINQEQQSRALINHTDLSWEDNCLNFHNNNRVIKTASQSQVRQKLYNNSMYKWKNYEKFLEPVKIALKDEIDEYENELKTRLGNPNE